MFLRGRRRRRRRWRGGQGRPPGGLGERQPVSVEEEEMEGEEGWEQDRIRRRGEEVALWL